MKSIRVIRDIYYYSALLPHDSLCRCEGELPPGNAGCGRDHDLARQVASERCQCGDRAWVVEMGPSTATGRICFAVADPVSWFVAEYRSGRHGPPVVSC